MLRDEILDIFPRIWMPNLGGECNQSRPDAPVAGPVIRNTLITLYHGGCQGCQDTVILIILESAESR
jgi:hypothetical protein